MDLHRQGTNSYLGFTGREVVYTTSGLQARIRFVTARYKVVPLFYKPKYDLYRHGTKLYLSFISQNGFVPARYKFVPLFYKPKWICTGQVQICTSVLQAGKWFVPQPRDDLYMIIKYHGGTNPQFCCLLGSPGAR